jgi:hypothetical protein
VAAYNKSAALRQHRVGNGIALHCNSGLGAASAVQPQAQRLADPCTTLYTAVNHVSVRGAPVSQSLHAANPKAVASLGLFVANLPSVSKAPSADMVEVQSNDCY